MRSVLAALKSHARLLRAVLARTPAQAGPVTREQRVFLGTSELRLCVTEQGAGGLTFVNVHENERTSVRAARALLQEQPGRLVELRAQGQRLVAFRIGLHAHTLDPNRIFTDAGVAGTLAALGPDSPAARAAAQVLREAVLALLPTADGRPIIALHNNVGQGYTVVNYGAGGRLAADSARIHLGQPASPNEFFVVTEPALFEPLAADGFNVVLQSETAFDDGSLSLWAHRARRPYINVEAREGQLTAQSRMLVAVARHFAAPLQQRSADRQSMSRYP